MTNATHPTLTKIREQVKPAYQTTAERNLGDIQNFLAAVNEEFRHPSTDAKMRKAAKLVGLSPALFTQMLINAAIELESARDNFHLEVLCDK
jgi:hypothetical protein